MFVQFAKNSLSKEAAVWDAHNTTATDYTVHITFNERQIANWEQQALNNFEDCPSKGMKLKKALISEIER